MVRLCRVLANKRYGVVVLYVGLESCGELHEGCDDELLGLDLCDHITEHLLQQIYNIVFGDRNRISLLDWYGSGNQKIAELTNAPDGHLHEGLLSEG